MSDSNHILLRASGGAFVISVLIPWIVAFSFIWLPGLVPYSAYYAMCTVLPYFVIFLVTMFVMSRQCDNSVFGLNLSSAISSSMLACFAQSAIYPMMLFLSSLCTFIWPGNTSGFEDFDATLISMGPLWGYFAMAFMPAVCEELLFRGLIYGAFRKQGFAIAALGSTLSFSLMHGNIEQIFYTMLFGLLLAFVREFSGSIIPGMGAHFVLNSTGVTMMYFGDAIFGGSDDNAAGDIILSWNDFWNENLSLLIIGIFGLALAVLFVFLIKKSCKYRYEGQAYISGQDLPFSYLLGWGLCLFQCWLG